MSEDWAEAHSELLTALEAFKQAGGDEAEAHSAVDDVYFEDSELYKRWSGGSPKKKKPQS